tara:strand:- start:667 stop:1410 length:744 start_codon:yes stop_codon:yes gene_type:complete
MAIGKKLHSGKFTKDAPTKFIGAALSIAGGVAGMIGGNKAAKAAARQQQAAQQELNVQKEAFEGLDRSNLYEGIQTEFENVYEDQTIDQRAADFQAQQGAQQRSNIMEGMKSAAGGSGVAALAQQMASQGQMAAQQQSASIGQQERANQAAMLGGAQAVSEREQAARMQVLAGEGDARAAEESKVKSMMGMASGKLQSANQAVAAAKAQKSAGMSGIIGGVGGALGGLAGGGALGKGVQGFMGKFGG